MKRSILILHNAYQQPGGEDVVVMAEAELLRAAGHRVHVETVSNDSISTIATKIRTFWKAPNDQARAKWVQDLIGKLRPDIVHIHNFFPLLTPAVHVAVAQLGVPMVQTLHNYRLLCANAQFVRNGTVCEKCLSGTRLWGVAHRCYRGSLAGSLAVVRMQHHSFREEVWQRHVHRYIALTDFSRKKFIAGGLPQDRITVKPNFVTGIAHSQSNRKGALFVGRLSPEKGVDTLLRAWHELPHIPLTIIGDGPECYKLKSIAPSNVIFMGYQSRDRVSSSLAEAQALIMPSIWYEGFPMTLVEAFASGLPILASDIGSLKEIIEPSVNGVHFASGDPFDLTEKARSLFANPDALKRLGAGARAAYEKRYTPETNLKQLEKIYTDAISTAGRNAPN